jgi:Rad3-related DNA helicase
LQERFIPKLSLGEQMKKEEDPEWISPRDEYLNKVKSLDLQKDYYGDQFVVKATVNKVGMRSISTTFEFIPDSLGSAVTNLLISYGEYVILMSGTIYDKNTFCKNLGLKQDDVYFIRVPSTFPLENRPLYAKPEYQVDTSHQMWDENFKEMIEKMSKIMDIFHDAKGLIHAPSYQAAQQIVEALPGKRAITHSSQDLQQRLNEFYNSKEPLVFVSPVCQQGVDFKYDRARFQIITRVPYLNTNDEFINYKVKNDFPWYNYQALVVFGQQIGRVNRAEDDYGATFLMDSRFGKFVTRNSKVIPKWVQNAIVWR